jgi:hypothetical protein
MNQPSKVIIILISIIGLCVKTLFAMGATIGVRGGVNINSTSGYDGAHYSGTNGANVAFCYGLDLNKVLSLQPEIIYSTKGANHLWVNVYAREFYDISISYIQVALLPKIRIPLNGPVVPYMAIGPSLAFPLHISDATSTMGRDMKLPERMKPLDYTFIFGPGCMFRMGSAALTIDARFDLGQQYILNEEDRVQNYSSNNSLPYQVNTQAFSISAGIAWLIGSTRRMSK